MKQKGRIRIRRPGAAPYPNANQIAVSIVITCYNYGRYLRASAGSALDQEGVSVEVIIVDDASPDGSADTARELAATDSRVRVLALEKNRGPAGAFNAGMELCQGTYVVRLDADDLLTPGSLSRAVSVLDRFPSVGLVYGHPVHFSSVDPPTDFRAKPTSWTLWPGPEWIRLRCVRAVNCITSPEVVVRRDVLTRTGGMKEFAYAHDLELWMRVATLSDVAHVNGVDQAFHRMHSASLTATLIDKQRDLNERKAAFDELFAGQLDGAAGLDPTWHARALDGLAREALGDAVRLCDHGRYGTATGDGYVEFARAASEHTSDMPEWAALERRLRWGSRLVQASGLALVSRGRRWLTSKVIGWRWDRTGV